MIVGLPFLADLLLDLNECLLTRCFEIFSYDACILRPGTSEFIAQQMQIMARMQAEQEKRAQERGSSGRQLGRPRQQQELEIPPVPPLPS